MEKDLQLINLIHRRNFGMKVVVSNFEGDFIKCIQNDIFQIVIV